MTLCTGLAILGLCFPLPGHTRDEVEATGWFVRHERIGGWWSSRRFAADTYSIVVGVYGYGNRLRTLTVIEPPSDYPHLAPLMDKYCSPASGRVRFCRFAGREQLAMQCFGGWMISAKAKAADDIKLQEYCQKLAPLFEDALKKGK